MFELEMISSGDINRVGCYEYHSNLISIGSSPHDDFMLFFGEMKQRLLSLEVTPQKEIIITPQEIDFFWVNEKKTNSPKRISANDSIQVGDNQFKILKGEYVEGLNYNKHLSHQFDKLKQENSPFLKVLKLLKDQDEN